MTARLVAKSRGSGATYTLDGSELIRVTECTNALPMNLKQFGADAAADYVLAHWEELIREPSIVKRADAIRYAHRRTLRQAANRGTRIHGYGERLVAGEAVEIPDEDRGPAEAYARFLDEWGIEPVATETPLCHTKYGYGGRADLWATIGARAGGTALMDVKTGKGIYESTVLQLAAYRHAELWQPHGPESEEPLPPVDLVYVAHVLPDSVRMVPIIAGEDEFRAFLYVQQTAWWLRRHRPKAQPDGEFRADVPLILDAETPDKVPA